MDNDRTRIVSSDDDGMTRAVLDFGPPDETLNEAEQESVVSGTTSMRSQQVRLNRNFLQDAAPFELEGFGQLLEARSARLPLCPAPDWSLPGASLVLVRGARGSGKSCLMMNLMWRLAELYPQQHLLFYSFERMKPEILLRMLLLGAQQLLPGKKTLDEHLEHWRKMLLSEDPESLKKRSAVEAHLSGLAFLLQQGHRLHVVDRLGDMNEIAASLDTFAQSLPLAAAFIDGGDWLLHADGREKESLSLPQLLAQLRRAARSRGIAVVMSLSEALPETPGSSTLYEAVAQLSEPWGGGDGSLVVNWLEPGHNRKYEIPMVPYNQRFVWNRLREAEEIE